MSSDEAIPRIPDLECTNLEFLLSVQDAAVRADAAAKLLEKVKKHGGLESDASCLETRLKRSKRPNEKIWDRITST
jgi:hypothetical protein